MTSVGQQENDLKSQLIQEVSRVQTSNLRRVESTSGMKTIFSSDDYKKTHGQPKPNFRIHGVHHGHRGHGGHKTPQSPGKSRVKAINNEHKAITPDLFEKRVGEILPSDSKHSGDTKTQITSFIPPDDPLATSTLKPEISGSRSTSVRGMSENDENDVNAHIVLSTTTDKTGEDVTVSKVLESEMNGGTVVNTSSFEANGALNTSSLERDSGHVSSSMDQSDERNKNLATSERAEIEMTLPNDKIQHSAGWSGTESTMTEEDHAIKALLDLAENQEAELKEAEANNANLQDQLHHVSASEPETYNVDYVSAEKAQDDLHLRREKFTRESLPDSVKMEQRNSNGFTSFFDLKDIISSTPQAGSLYEGNSTPSEMGSVYSGTGGRSDRDRNAYNSNRTSSQSDPGLEPVIVTEITETVNASPQSNRSVDKGVLANHDSDISPDNSASKDVIGVTENDKVLDDKAIIVNNGYNQDDPSQVEIEETQRRFDQILADLSTSMEEDFTMSEKTVGRQLSSDADVIVHSTDDDMSDAETQIKSYEADTVQEFADLESSVISVPDDAAITSSATKTDSISRAKSGNDFSLLELSRLATASGQGIAQRHSLTKETDSCENELVSVSRTTSGNIGHHINGSSYVEGKVTSRETETYHNDHNLTPRSNSEQDTSQEFLNLETSQHHLKSTEASAHHRVSGSSLESQKPTIGNTSQVSHNNDQNAAQSFSELNSSFHTAVGVSKSTDSPRSTEHTDNKLMYSDVPQETPGDRLSYQETGVYSEAYQTTTNVDSPRDSVSENSPVYESISEDLNSSTGQEKLSDSMSLENKPNVSGRLSPLGAEVSSDGNKSSWNRESYAIGGGQTILRVSSIERKKPYGVEKTPDSSYLSKPRPFGFKKQSEFQTLSENVNVKGLAKQLEKSLDFSKMFRPAGENTEELQKDNAPKGPKKQHVKSQDPKDAFGLVLSEIFQKTRLRSTDDDDEQAHTSIPSFENYGLKKTALESLLKRNLEEEDSAQVSTNEGFEPQSESAQKYVSVTQSSVQQFEPDSKAETENPREYLKEERSVEVSDKINDTYKPVGFTTETQPSLDVSLPSEKEQPDWLARTLTENLSSTEVSIPAARADTPSPPRSRKSDRSSSTTSLHGSISDSDSPNEYLNEVRSSAEMIVPVNRSSVPEDVQQKLYGVELQYGYEFDRREFDKNSSKSDETEEQITYETEEVIVYDKQLNDADSNFMNKNGDDDECVRNESATFYDRSDDRSIPVTFSSSDRQSTLSTSFNSQPEKEVFQTNDRQTSLINNNRGDQSVKYQSTSTYEPGRIWGYNTKFNSSRPSTSKEVSSFDRQNIVSESDQDESLGSVTTLQDNDNFSDISDTDDTLSRTEEIAGGDDKRHSADYTSQRDISRNTSFSEDTYTSVHEEFYVPVASQQAEREVYVESSKDFDEVDSYPSYRERFLGESSARGPVVTHSQSSTETFLHEPARPKEIISDSNDRFFEIFPSVNAVEQPGQVSRQSGLTRLETTDISPAVETSQPSQLDTVQGRSVWQAYKTGQVDNSVFTAPSGYTEKPAEQLRENNINIAKKGDSWDHVTFSSSNHPVYGVETSSDSDVTTPRDIEEEFSKRAEKLSEKTFSTNFTSESRPGKYEKSLNGSNHSLFYDGPDEARQVNGVNGVYYTSDRDSRQRGNKYQKGSMAYLLTTKDNVSTSHSRSGRSTPQGKLYESEVIMVSPTAVDERRGSHSSRDYLNDNHDGQELFHFNMKSPSNNDRNSIESRGERIRHTEKTERHYAGPTSDHVERLPDTYIGSKKAPDLVVPVQYQSNANGQRSKTVSRDSPNVTVHEIKSSSHNHGKHDGTDGKRSRGKKSEHIRTGHVTTSYSSPQNHTGTDRNGHHQQTNVIHIETNSTGRESGLRERRDAELTDKRVTGKPSGDDNISNSSFSSQSSSSLAEAGHSFDSPSSRNHQRNEKPIFRTEESRRVPISVQYLPETRIHANQGSMPKHAKKTHDSRVYHSGNADPDNSDRDSRSTKDVQYLIKSLENEAKQPRRPIPGVHQDAFRYHVTSPGNENKSSSRNNHVNEVDVTTREAMRDRSKKGQGSSHVIKQFKEERIVEDVKGPPSSIHVAPDRGHHGRTIVLQNGQVPNRAIQIHPPSLDRSDSDRTATFEDSKRSKKKVSSGETKVYVDSSAVPNHKVKSEKVRTVNREKTYHKGHSVHSDDNSSDEEGGKHRKAESGKVSTVVYDFRSKSQPSLSNVVHLEGAKGLKTRDSVNSQGIYSIPRKTEESYRTRSSSESSLSDHEHRKGTILNKAKSEELWLTQDLNQQQPRKYKSENVFYEHYNVKRDNPMYVEGDRMVYVSPHTKRGHGTRSPTREIYVDTKPHPTTRHQLSSSFSSISPTGSPTPEDRHVTTVSFDESFNRKRSGSPMGENHIYQPKVHVKKHRVVKTDEQFIRPAESDNELYVRGSKSSPYRVVVKGDRHRSGRSSDTDESFYSDSRTTGSHRSTINISRGSDRRPDPHVPAVMSIPLSNQPVAMTIPGVQETKYVTNKSERMELRRSASLDSIRDMVDYPNNVRSEKVLRVGSSSDLTSSPEMRSPSSPYVSTITILNRKLNVKDPNIDSGTGTEVISSDDDIRYRSQLNPVKEEVVYATKEAPRETRRSEKHTTYSTYEEYRDGDNFEYVAPKQQKVTTIHRERQIPIREERIHAVREDRAKAVRETLHEKFRNMSYEQSREPQQVEQKSTSDLKVVRGQFVIRNSMDIDLDEGDSLGVDDNINIFDNSFTMNKENPLYQSDPDLYNKFESETVEERNIRIRQGDFGDGVEDIIHNTRQAAVKSAPNKKKQNLSQMLLSKLAQIDSKDITQHIDVQHHNEEIYGDIKFIHADGSKAEAMDTTNFDSVSEHIDLMLKEGKALITIKVTAERIIPIDFEFNVWRKSQAIVTRNIEIDLKANDQRRRLYEHVMETTPSKMIGSSSTGYLDSNEAVLSSKDTLKLFSRLLSVAEKDDKAIARDEVRYETKHRDRSDSLPSLNNVDMLY